MRDSYQTLLNYSFRLLGKKSYTEHEILEKLNKRAEKLKLPDAALAIQKVLARLKEWKYVDDDKILENYFEYRLQARPRGKYAFLNEMRRRGIVLERARNEWEKRNIQEEALALDLVKRKRKQLKKLTGLALKKKIAAFLASRGFSPSTVWGVFDKM